MEKNKYNRLNNYLKKSAVIAFGVLIIIQIYTFIMHSSDNKAFIEIDNSDAIIIKEVQMMPKYGEISFSIGESFTENVKLRIKEKDYHFKNSSINAVVKNGDIIEIQRYNSKESILIEITDISNNINGIDESQILLEDNSTEIIVVNLE